MLSANEYVRGTLVPKTLLEPLGYLSVWFSLLEENLDVALIIFLDLDLERGHLIVAQFNSFGVKLKLLEKLAESQIQDEHYKAQFCDITRRMREANTARNDIVHGSWHYSIISLFDPTTVHKRSVNREGRQDEVQLDENKIMKAANDALDAALRLETILKTLPRVPPKA